MKYGGNSLGCIRSSIFNKLSNQFYKGSVFPAIETAGKILHSFTPCHTSDTGKRNDENKQNEDIPNKKNTFAL